MSCERTNYESKDFEENHLPLDGVVELAETGHQHYHSGNEEGHGSNLSIRSHHSTSVEEPVSPQKSDFHGMEFLDDKHTESRRSSRTMDSPRSILKDISLSLHHLYDKMPIVADRFNHNTIEEEGDEPDLIETKSQMMLYGSSDAKKSHTGSSKAKANTFKGVYVPTCEMMWGVIIFVRFGWITGQAGVGLALLAVILCAITATLTASSLSAIATNGMVGGGAYHLLTRSLGPAWGGSISTIYYVGLTILSTVEIAGFSEILVNLIGNAGKEFTGSAYWDNVVLSMLGLSLIFCLAMIGLTFLQNLAVIFMVALLLGYVATFAGIFASPHSGSPVGVTGIRSTTLRTNMSPLFAGAEFADVMALMFPCFLGLMSGINQTAHLRNPYKSIPRGTFMAVCTSFGIYTLLFIFLGSFAKRDLLISDKMLLIDSSWPTKWIAIVGAILVGFGSSMQCLMVAPRTLQAIAKGKILMFLEPLGLETLWKGEPRKALIVSFMLAFPFLFIPELDTLAIIATMCFLQSYASANIVCFLMSVLQIPSWRPKYRYYHWTTALLGFMFCLSIMFIIHWIAALCSLFAFIVLAGYIQWAQEVKDWGEGIKGLQVHLALVGLLGAENEARKLEREREKNPDLVHPVSRIWRPHYLCFVGIDEDHLAHPRLLSLLHQLKASRGLCIVAHVVDEFRQPPDNGTNYEKAVEVVEQRRRVIQRAMVDEDLDGFTNVISSLSQGEGMVTLLQGAGLSSLAPNTMLCAWPDEWKKDSSSSFRHISLLKWVRAHKKSAVFVKGVDSFPSSKELQTGAIDVWWIVHEGGFLMLLAVLLRKSKTWKKCRLRIFTVAELTENSLAIENQIKNYLYYLRIKAEVHIVEMSTHQFAYFTNEWTVLREGRFGGPAEDKARFFPSFIDELHGVRHRARAERITSITSIDPASLDLSPRNFNFTAGSTMTLQKAIVDHSQYSDLIIMNMPVPSQMHLQSPDEYMEMIDFLTLPLRRVLLVSGCGQEVIQVD